MLEDILKNYRNKAEHIEWKKYNPNELFFEYIKHENDELGEYFYAAIICRFWGQAGRIYIKCNRHIPFEECYDCVLDSIKYVIEKRVWENPNSSLYNDPAGPDKAVHIALKRQMAIMLSKYTAQRRLSNFNTLSIDEAHENYNDSADGLLFDIQNDDHLKSFISEYFEKGEILNGLFLDTICYSGSKYDSKSIIKHIKSITIKDADHFTKEYNISNRDFKKMLIDINEASTKYLEIKLNSLLYKIRNEGLFND